MPPHLQKEIRADKRLDASVEGAPDVGGVPQGGLGVCADPHAGELADTKKELAKLKAEVKAAAKAAAKANATQTFAAATKGKGRAEMQIRRSASISVTTGIAQRGQLPLLPRQGAS